FALVENEGAVWAGSSGGLFIKPKDAASFSRVPSAPSSTITITGADETEQPVQAETQQPAQDPVTPQPDIVSARESVRPIAGFRGQIYAAFFDGGVERIEKTANGFARAPVLTDAAARRAICFAVERRNNTDAALWFGNANGELRRFDGAQTTSFTLPQKL